VTPPIKPVGIIRLGRLAKNGKSKMAVPGQVPDFRQIPKELVDGLVEGSLCHCNKYNIRGKTTGCD